MGRKPDSGKVNSRNRTDKNLDQQRDFFVDLAAERPIAAEKAGSKIIVEIKSFVGYSVMQDFEKALGQYLLCWLLMLNRRK